jgi:hypothetical protein
MVHVCITAPFLNSMWESKFGQRLRAMHELGELDSGDPQNPAIYGTSANIYYWRANFPPPGRRLLSALTDDQAAVVGAEAAKLSPGLRQQFEEAFASWKRTWSLPHIAFSSNTSSATHGAEFQRLVALGPETIPAIVKKLIEPENFFALQLYDRLQSRRDLAVSVEPPSEEILEGEQGRARRTVQRFATSL